MKTKQNKTKNCDSNNDMIASHEEGNLKMCCLRRRTLKLLNLLFLSFSPSGVLQKEMARYYSQ